VCKYTATKIKYPNPPSHFYAFFSKKAHPHPYPADKEPLYLQAFTPLPQNNCASAAV
jgi:hypothetical protein